MGGGALNYFPFMHHQLEFLVRFRITLIFLVHLSIIRCLTGMAHGSVKRASREISHGVERTVRQYPERSCQGKRPSVHHRCATMAWYPVLYGGALSYEAAVRNAVPGLQVQIRDDFFVSE
jgi:hypothetical protein